MRQKLEDLGTYIRLMPSADLVRYIADERQAWKRVLQRVGIKPQ